jgi:hypothetical protein
MMGASDAASAKLSVCTENDKTVGETPLTLLLDGEGLFDVLRWCVRKGARG